MTDEPNTQGRDLPQPAEQDFQGPDDTAATDPGPGTGAGTGPGSGPGAAPDSGSGSGSGGTGTGTGPEAGTRRERFDCTGPAELEIATGGGRVRVDLVEGADEVRVAVAADRPPGTPWSGGLGGLLDWIGSSMTGGPAAGAGWSGRGFEPIAGAPWEATGDPSADAVDAVQISWSADGRRLVLRGPEDPTLGAVPLAVTVSAPAGSRPAVRTGAAGVELTGRADRASVRTGSGTARVAEVTGDAEVTTGSGGIDLGSCGGRANLRTGGGVVEVGSLGGPSRVRTGSGDIKLGELTGDLEIRSGSGDVVLADAVSGEVVLGTGSGNVRVGVHSGVAAALDLSTGSGRARSELDVHGGDPATAPGLRLRGRTGSGDVLVTRAAAAAA
ncbi:DUF4097 family beta strand repeat-containing protein [Pseudonocardia nantongensis]|uniref:DUF4097 family beta strand repeat-containing protein n=1 Tax=Pseudonocardia nantongensis TaxID=1181885 RepID=UPI0039781112